jgi:hypothetical protein
MYLGARLPRQLVEVALDHGGGVFFTYPATDQPDGVASGAMRTWRGWFLQLAN